MASSTSNLDSLDALEAFRTAMSLSGAPSFARRSQSVEHSESAPSIEPSVKSRPEGSFSNEEERNAPSETGVSNKTVAATSDVKKCLTCGQDVNQISITSSAKSSSSKDSHRDDEKDTLGLSNPTNQRLDVSSSEAKITEVEKGLTTTSSAAASIAKNTNSTTTSVLRGTNETTPLSHSGTPIHHRALADLVSEDVTTPINGGLRVPQNSPANALTILPGPIPTSSNETDDPFTREEAHDVVIDIFKELAALSERSQKNSPTKSMPTQSRGLAPRNAIQSGQANNHSRDTPIDPSKGRQSGLFTTPKGSTNSSPVEISGTDENLPPHLRPKEHQAEMRSKASATEDDPAPPHLRTPKHQLRTSPASKATTNYFSVLDPSHVSALSNKLKADVKENSEIRTAGEHRSSKPEGLRSLSTSSSGSSSTPLAHHKEDKADKKLDQGPEFDSPTILATKPAIEEDAAPPTSPNFHANFLELQKKPHDFDKPILQADLPSWFVDKYSSKKTTTPSKTVTSDDSPPEDLEHQTVFKEWAGQSDHSRPVAGIRTCTIRKIPAASTLTFVCNLVFGGPLEFVKIISDPISTTARATIRFFSVDDCKRFYDATANGISLMLGTPPREYIAWVKFGKEVDVVGGLLAQYIDQGATRCVRAVPVNASIQRADLLKLGGQKGRELEGLEDSVSQTGSRSVVWRFCDVSHAVAFRGVLARNEAFESCNVSFAEDPCALRVRAKEA